MYTQMLGITLLLFAAKASPGDLAERAVVYGLPLLGVAATITFVSLADYFRKLWSAL